jgi:hypothetical protein
MNRRRFLCGFMGKLKEVVRSRGKTASSTVVFLLLNLFLCGLVQKEAAASARK